MAGFLLVPLLISKIARVFVVLPDHHLPIDIYSCHSRALDAYHLHPAVNDTPIFGAGTCKAVGAQARDKVRANCSV